MHSSGLGKLIRVAFAEVKREIEETLSDEMLDQLKMPGRVDAFDKVHSPKTHLEAEQSLRRLRFEEFLYLQLTLLKQKQATLWTLKGLGLRPWGRSLISSMLRGCRLSLLEPKKE